LDPVFMDVTTASEWGDFGFATGDYDVCPAT